jgi:hypothetical protein
MIHAKHLGHAQSKRNVAGKATDYAHDDIMYRVRRGEVLRIPQVCMRTQRQSFLALLVPQAQRYSSRDWLHHLITMPNSQILKRISGVVNFNIMWSLFIFLLFKFLGFQPAGTRAHTLVGSALGLLLVVRQLS